jgi:DNA-binding NarL/FixJ family response regulator
LQKIVSHDIATRDRTRYSIAIAWKAGLMPTLLIIADGHTVVRLGLTALLGRVPNMKIIASCNDGVGALRKIRTLKPDIAVLDVNLPLMGGLDILAVAKSEKLTTRIILLSEHFDDFVLRSAITAGASGLVLKDATKDDYVSCLTQVSKGLNWMSPKLLARMAASGNRIPADDTAPIHALRSLTVRERQVANMVRLGISNREIARKLGVAEGTIKNHLHNIYRKVGVPNRTTLTAKIGSTTQ